jgi:hypothetical protein
MQVGLFFLHAVSARIARYCSFARRTMSPIVRLRVDDGLVDLEL